MRFKNPTEEEKAIDAAMDAHLEALEFEHHVFRGSLIMYMVGFPLFIFGSDWAEMLGISLVTVGLLSFIAHFFFSISTRKKALAVQKLLQPYLKKKSLPLFRDLQEKFADDPNIRFVHNDDGSVTVMRKKGDDNM